MFATTIYGRPTEMQGSIMAVMAYYDEFGTDFHQDYWKASESGYAPVAFLLRAAWAMAFSCAQAKGELFPHFKEWQSAMTDFNLRDAATYGGWVGDVSAAIRSEMFRDETAKRPKEGE